MIPYWVNPQLEMSRSIIFRKIFKVSRNQKTYLISKTNISTDHTQLLTLGSVSILHTSLPLALNTNHTITQLVYVACVDLLESLHLTIRVTLVLVICKAISLIISIIGDVRSGFVFWQKVSSPWIGRIDLKFGTFFGLEMVGTIQVGYTI